MKNKNNFDLKIIFPLLALSTSSPFIFWIKRIFSLSLTMCYAITKSGNVCKIKSETHFCHIHQPAPESQPEPTLEEKRNRIISKLLSTSGITFTLQLEAWPLFRGIDLTIETIGLINRSKFVYKWSDETYNTVFSTYLDDGVEEEEKYELFRAMIGKSRKLGKSLIEKIQVNDLCQDVIILFIKYILSKGRYFDFRDFRKNYAHFLKVREEVLNIHREENIKKLMVKEVEKHTPICDDVRKYILAHYL